MLPQRNSGRQPARINPNANISNSFRRLAVSPCNTSILINSGIPVASISNNFQRLADSAHSMSTTINNSINHVAALRNANIANNFTPFTVVPCNTNVSNHSRRPALSTHNMSISSNVTRLADSSGNTNSSIVTRPTASSGNSSNHCNKTRPVASSGSTSIASNNTKPDASSGNTRISSNIRRGTFSGNTSLQSSTQPAPPNEIGSPSYWDTMNESDPYTAIPLHIHNYEYQHIKKLIHESAPNFIPISIKRLQNRDLFVVYNTHLNSLRKRFPNVKFREEQLFHGTNSNLLHEIASGNFDPRRYGESVGCVYGQGTYFSNSAKYSLDYGKGNPKALFVVKVIIGKIAKGRAGMKRPPDAYDTTVDDVENPNIFVKYDSKEYYPEYYIEYN